MGDASRRLERALVDAARFSTSFADAAMASLDRGDDAEYTFLDATDEMARRWDVPPDLLLDSVIDAACAATEMRLREEGIDDVDIEMSDLGFAVVRRGWELV